MKICAHINKDPMGIHFSCYATQCSILLNLCFKCYTLEIRMDWTQLYLLCCSCNVSTCFGVGLGLLHNWPPQVTVIGFITPCCIVWRLSANFHCLEIIRDVAYTSHFYPSSSFRVSGFNAVWDYRGISVL